jgi:hypothetical protein
MKDLLHQLEQTTYLAIPKSIHRLDHIEAVFGAVAGETNESWLVPCSHVFNPPATVEQIEAAERRLGLSFPDEYKRFLTIANGAKLFIVRRRWIQESFPGSDSVRHYLFGCDELVRLNNKLLATFLANYAGDPEYKQTTAVNYLAFCNAEDGNYQAFHLESAVRTKPVFLLFHELLYRPYSVLDSEFYYTISESMTSWLELVLQSGGWEGRGSQVGGL